MICLTFLCRNKAMRAAAFSADGSVLAVAADTVITLWDPDRNVLVAVVGETSTVIFLNPFHHSLSQSFLHLKHC